MRRPARIALALVAVGAIAASTAAVSGEGAPQALPERPSYESTAVVERRDLVETTSFDGSLGYSDSRPVFAGGGGTLTYVAAEGSAVTRGETIYAIGGAGVVLLYGKVPMYRDLAYGVDDGDDVRQLETNLVAMGHDPGGEITVDGEWTHATTAAVERWEDARGAAQDGTVGRGEVVFLSGPRIAGDHVAALGAPVAPGATVLATSSRERNVSLAVDVADVEELKKGKKVRIELPTGAQVRGRVASVGRVATVDETDEDSAPTVDVAITITGDDTAGRIDQASVEVLVETSRKRAALAVPVSALLATGDGFAIEIVEGSSLRLVEVTVGTFAEGWVEIDGAGVTPGAEVVTAS